MTLISGRIQPRALLLDIYGSFVRELGGWISIAGLIVLMSDLGVDEQAVRAATSRMKRRGLLTSSRKHAWGYGLTPRAERILARGDRRIFQTVDPNSDGKWIVAAFSVPESNRDRRHVLRSRLVWLGLGNLAPGVWIGPAHVLDDVRDTLAELDLGRYVDIFIGQYHGFADVKAMVARAWDLDELRALHTAFLNEHRGVLDPWQKQRNNDRQAFIDYTLAVTQWRKLPFLDPGFAEDVLPPNWEGRRASRLFHEILHRLRPPALAYVRKVANESSGQKTRGGR